MSEAAKSIVSEWLEEFDLPDLVEREAAHPPLDGLKDILAIVGPRRAGKTFYFFQLIRELMASGVKREEILFVDFEDYRLPDLGSDPVDALLTAHHQIAGRAPVFLFFDEVQQLPGWSRTLRTLHNRRTFRIVISGSNSKLLSREVATELRGRCIELAMFPFSFREYLRLRGIAVSPGILHGTARGKIIGAFDDYLRGGGFPDVAAATSLLRKRQLLQSYFQTTYYRDILERYDVRAKESLESLMRHAVDQAGDLFSISAFTAILRTRGIEASKRTIANYLGYLEDAFFVILSEKFARSQRQRTANPVKCYLFDTGFKQLAVNFSENRGKLLENLVAIELRRRGRDFFYFRDGGECDFVVASDSRPRTAIQVCWELHEGNRKRELEGIRQATEALAIKDRFFLTYNQPEPFGGIPSIPVWRWLLEGEEPASTGRSRS
jgi:predicted AAA+ superfamily ATPase